MKAYELLSEESKLCRRNYANSKEEPSNFISPVPYNGVCKAFRWDIIGALMYCYPDYTEYYKHYNAIMYSPRINEWVKTYKDALIEAELTKIRKTYGVNWVIFNDFAKFDEIHGLLKEMDI